MNEHSQSQEAHAPGRVEMLGNHTDYNDGVVLAAAVDLGVHITGEVRGDARISVRSETLGREVDVALDAIRPVPGEEWAGYVLGVARELLDAGHPVGGFSARLDSTVPVGAGLSSSAAIEVATATLLCKLFGLAIEPMEVARLCRRAEVGFVGVSCGLLDQASSVFGRRDHFIHLDCRAESVVTIPVPPGHGLLVVNTHVRHALSDGGYNARREDCHRAARLLDVPALRDVTPEDLEARGDRLDATALRRARHVVGECDRVRRGADALRAGDASAFGALMFESHQSSVENFENSTPELDLLVRLARTTPGVLGSRLTGGGFGGATVSLVAEEAIDAASVRLATGYREATGFEARAWRCAISDGAV